VRIKIQFTAEDREQAAHELNMINYHVMDAINEMGERKHLEKVVALANGARVITINK
jgi:hypothetical protein